MSYLTLGLAVALMTALWPLNRRAMKNQARSERIGVAVTTVGTILAALGALITGQPFVNAASLLYGSITGVSYAVGFCLIIFYCLKIGPSGPTVTLNNLGLLFPVLIGIAAFSATNALSVPAVVGIALIIIALILMAFNKTEGETSHHSAKWFVWVLLGWMLSGFSMGAQFVASQLSPGKPFTFAFCANVSALLVLLLICLVKRSSVPKKQEWMAGAATGLANIVSTVVIFYLVGTIPAYVIYPVIMAAPILAMLVIGNYVYKEKMNAFGWSSCLVGTAALILLGLR